MRRLGFVPSKQGIKKENVLHFRDNDERERERERERLVPTELRWGGSKERNLIWSKKKKEKEKRKKEEKKENKKERKKE